MTRKDKGWTLLLIGGFVFYLLLLFGVVSREYVKEQYDKAIQAERARWGAEFDRLLDRCGK